MAKKRARKNYYKNSLARRRQRLIERCLLGLKITLLIGGMAGTSLLLILTYDALTQTSYFEAKSITVEGNKELSRETVLKQAGLKLHENILSVNVSTIRHRLVAHPWVAGAEIERALPDTIHIRVKERTPIAMINLERLFYLDETGVIFKPVEPSDKASVPVVTGLPVTDIDFEDPLRSRWFTEVMEVLRLSHIHKDRIPFYVLHRIHVDREMGLTLYASLSARNPSATPRRALTLASSGDTRVQAGYSAVAIRVGFGGYASKFGRLRYMASYLKQEDESLNLQFIDLSDSDRVVVRPSETGQAERRSVAEGSDHWSHKRKEV